MKKNIFVFVFFNIIIAEEQNFWDLGVKINKKEESSVKKEKETKQQKDNNLFNEIVGLSNKLNISQKIIDEENKLLNEKIEINLEKPSLIFNNKKKKIQSKKTNAYQLGRYKDAINYLNNINQSNITKIEEDKISYLKANAYFNLGEYEQAKKQLTSLISKKQSQLLDDALLLQGIILKQEGKKEEALSVFNQIVAECPNSEFYESAQIQKRILSKIKE